MDEILHAASKNSVVRTENDLSTVSTENSLFPVHINIMAPDIQASIKTQE